MPNWTGGIITARGRELQAKVEAGETLVITKMKLGSGTPQAYEMDTLTDLKQPLMEFGISSKTVENNICEVTGVVVSSEIETPFYAREWGLFAQDPDEGEILYMYTTDPNPDFIPAKTAALQISATYALNIVVLNVDNIIVNIDPNGLVTTAILNNELKEYLPLSGGDMTGDITANNVYANNNVLVFNNVAEMKASNKVKAGYTLKTLGFYNSGDGGGADYVVTDNIGEDEVDEASIIALQKGLYAKIIINNNTINVKQFGLYGDNEHYDDEFINKALNYAYKITVDTKINDWVGYSAITINFPSNTIIKLQNSIDINISRATFNGNRCKFNVTDLNGEYVFKLAGDSVSFSNALIYFGNFILYSDEFKDILGISYKGIYPNPDNQIITSARVITKDVYMFFISRGILVSTNSYMNTFYNINLACFTEGFYLEHAGNSGERTAIYNSTFANAMGNKSCVGIINSSGNELNVINCSFDFIDVSGILKSNNGIIYFQNCHFENNFSPSNKNLPFFKLVYETNNDWVGCISLDSCVISCNSGEGEGEARAEYLCVCEYDVSHVSPKSHNFIMEKCRISGIRLPYYIINVPPYKISKSICGSADEACIRGSMEGICKDYISLEYIEPYIRNDTYNITVNKDTEDDINVIKIKSTNDTNYSVIYFYNKIEDNTVYIPNLTAKVNNDLTIEGEFVVRVYYTLGYFDTKGNFNEYPIYFGVSYIDKNLTTEYKNVLGFKDGGDKAVTGQDWNFSSKGGNFNSFSNNKNGMYIAMAIEIRDMPIDTEITIKRATIEVM